MSRYHTPSECVPSGAMFVGASPEEIEAAGWDLPGAPWEQVSAAVWRRGDERGLDLAALRGRAAPRENRYIAYVAWGGSKSPLRLTKEEADADAERLRVAHPSGWVFVGVCKARDQNPGFHDPGRKSGWI